MSRFMLLNTYVVGLVLAVGCNGGASSSQSGGGSGSFVQSRLKSAVASGATTFDFASDPVFAWDRMFVFGCYSSQDTVENGLGFRWADCRKTSIASSDGINLVVFVKDNTVVYWYEQPRSIELGGLANRSGCGRSEATFIIARTGGKPELKLTATPGGAGGGYK